MMGDHTHAVGQHSNSDEWSSGSDLKELRNRFESIGMPVQISPHQFAATLFEHNETRSVILTNIMKRIHPDDSFWIAKSEEEIQDKCFQVSKWFGLSTEASVVNGFGSYEGQLNFWIKVVSTAYELTTATSENVDNCNLDLNLAKIVQELVLSSSILGETIDNANKAAQSSKEGVSADNNYVVDEMIRFGVVEVDEMENGLEDLKIEALFDNFPTKRLENTSKRCRARLGSILKFYGQPSLPILWDPSKRELQNKFALQSSKKLQDIDRKLVKIKDAVYRVNRCDS